MLLQGAISLFAIISLSILKWEVGSDDCGQVRVAVTEQTRSQSLLICSSKAMKDWGEMMSRSRGRLGRANDFRAAFP